MTISKKLNYLVVSVPILIVMTLTGELSFANNYDVQYVDKGAITIDGVINLSEWGKTNTIDKHFHYPWRDENAPNTVFRAAWNEEGLYFSFDVDDENIVLAKTNEGEKAVDDSDRVEIFLAPREPNATFPSLEKYYGLEIAPNEIVHEYSAEYYRKFDSEWAFDNATYKSTINNSGYQVEGFIPMQNLAALNINIDNDSEVFMGVFRAEFRIKDNKLQSKWISWIAPKSKIPDFHIPSAFGLMKFVNKDQQ